jgi:hypothetical protein
MAKLHSQFLFDAALKIQDAGLIAASANGDYIVDLGAGLFDGFLVVDVSAIEVASADETYDLYLEGSNVAAMTSGSVALAAQHMGVAADPADADTATGRFAIPCRNEQNGTNYRYVRLRAVVAGTVATGINLSAFLAKR